MKTYNKLVRDKIPEIIKASGKSCETHVLDDETFILELKKKLIEEGNELLNAETKEEIIEELADLQEIVDTLLSQYSIDNEELKKLQVKKNEERGAFKDKLFLVAVSS